MKASYTLVASIIAASATAFSSSLSSPYGDAASFPTSGERLSSSLNKDGRRDSNSSSGMERFAPRFDGLRFIETLVTAHR